MFNAAEETGETLPASQKPKKILYVFIFLGAIIIILAIIRDYFFIN